MEGELRFAGGVQPGGGVFLYLRGSLTAKVLPTPSWLETSMLPPWAAMIARQIYNPSPVPEGA